MSSGLPGSRIRPLPISKGDLVTPLHIAAVQGHLEVAHLLLEAKADKEKAVYDGATPLLIAAHLGHLEVARLLLDAKADKDKAMNDGATALFIAAQRGHLEVARVLKHAEVPLLRTTVPLRFKNAQTSLIQ